MVALRKINQERQMLSDSRRSTKPRAARSTQALIALVAIIALESVFAAMARLGNLSDHIPNSWHWRSARAFCTSSPYMHSNTRKKTRPCFGSSSWARSRFA